MISSSKISDIKFLFRQNSVNEISENIFSNNYYKSIFKSLKNVYLKRVHFFLSEYVFFYLMEFVDIEIFAFKVFDFIEKIERNYEFKLKYPKNYIRSKIKNDIF